MRTKVYSLRRESSSRLFAWRSGHLLSDTFHPRRSRPLQLNQRELASRAGAQLTAETAQDTSGLVTLLVESRRPECFGAEFVGELVHGGAQLVDQAIQLATNLVSMHM